ncbi:MAG: hypothetical protein IKR52_02620, partial [Paludibacteraceae bacterium]|nr:hypothetical protein [Paludibacteraceae bacterium]
MKRVHNYTKNILFLLLAWIGIFSANATVTIYFYAEGWSSAYLWSWNGHTPSGWPGDALTKVAGTSNWWTITVSENSFDGYIQETGGGNGCDKNFPTISGAGTYYLQYTGSAENSITSSEACDLEEFSECSPMFGLTFLAGPFLISGQGTSDYAYADGTNISVTSNVANTSALGSEYMWDIYTVDAIAAGSKGRFTIVNVSTGEFMNIPTTKGNPFTLVDSQSTTTEITLWDYSTPAIATDANARAGLANTNIQGLDADNYKGIIKNSKLYVKDSESTGHFTFTKTSYPSSGPTAPTNVAAARASATSVTITWDAVDGASGYTLYKSTNGSSWDGGTAAATNSATDSGLTSDLRYYYKVTATAGGVESSASIVVSAVPGTLPSNLAFVAGPFMIRNNYTGFGYQYLYDNTTDNDYTGTEETKNGSDSDGTSYANYGRVLRNVQGADSDATYLTNANYMWDIYSYTIGGNTYYALRNVVTGRFMHTGAYTDYISQWGDNNSINAFAWNTTNVSGATGIDNSNNANKELSYYLYNFKVAAVEGTTPASQADATVNASGFTAQIMTQRWTWGQRSLHGQIGESLVSNNQVYATNNTYGWGTKSWLFTAATRPAPTGLTATPGATTADLAWNATEGTLIYTVYRSTTEGSGYAEIGTTTTNSYADSRLTKGTTYYYKVTATAGTSTSAQSAAVSVTTLIEPAAPTNVAAAPDCSATDKIIVTWDAVAGATSYDIEAYDNGTSEWYDKGLDITATTATITVAGGYKAYPIHVKAKNAAGSSAWANAAADGWPASPSPTLTVSGTTAASVTLAWTDIAGQTYDVYRSAYVDGNYKLLASGQSNGYTDNAVFSGSKYYYKLKVTDATCGTRWSNSVNTTTTHTLGVPVPRIKSKDVAKVTIEWNAVAGAGGYRIYRSTNGTNYDFIGLTNETTYTDDVNNGCNGYMSKHKTYFYKITAVEEGLEQWLYTDGVSYPNPCSDTEDLRTRVMEKALYAGRSEGYCSWRSDGGGYKFINGEVYKTKNDGKYQSCGTMSDGYAWFSNAVSTAGEYRLEAFVALNTGTTDVWMSANLANAANAADSTKAYVFFDNIVPLPSVEANCDNGSWQNYYPYEGALALNAGDNTVYYSIKGGQNVLKYTLSRGESDLSLAVAVEFIPAPSISAEATSITNARITWAKIEGADYYKIRYKDFTENKTTTEGIGWTEWALMPTANDTVYNFTINPTHQYRYQVKSFVGTIGNTPIAESAVANNYVSTKDYAPQLKASATGATSVRLKIMTTAKSRVSEVDSYTIYYSDDKENWTSATVSRVGTDT